MAIRTHPSYAIAYENLGDVYAKLASQAYDKALQLDNANATTQNKLALIRDLITTSSKGNVKPTTATPAVASKASPAAAPTANVVTTTPSAASTAPCQGRRSKVGSNRCTSGCTNTRTCCSGGQIRRRQ